jgi:hypothetical protein
VAVTHRERAHGLSGSRLASAVAAMRSNGFVVLANAADQVALRSIEARMLRDFDEPNDLAWVTHNFVWGHVQHPPPPYAPYLSRDVLCNRVAVSIVRALFGATPRATFYTANTNLPGSSQQPIHCDTANRGPEPDPPRRIALSIPLRSVDATNGAIELWPRTHTDVTLSHPSEETVLITDEKARTTGFQPRHIETELGDIIMRDMRLWHRGTANVSAVPRVMLGVSLTHSAVPHARPEPFHQSARWILSDPFVNWNASFEATEHDYLFRHKRGG